jgi:hypothetical protein
MILPASQLWVGSHFQNARKTRDPTVAMERKRLKKNAGIACRGTVSGLTLSRMITSDVIERRAASERPKRREVTGRVRVRVRT